MNKDLFREIVVDNFAGGGGASTGIEWATGRSVDIAVNHDPEAIAMHMANHPGTEHYCESVWDVDPLKAVNGRPVALVWLSPDCKYFSKAKGAQPVEKNIRSLAWVALRWAAIVKPRVIMLENVEEFRTWGPLVDGKPCPDRKGKTFCSFVNALIRQGYTVDWRDLWACDFGAPTIRKRLFMIARRDGRPITWPMPTHGDPGSHAVAKGRLKPWRTAEECIDWTLPCPSIFDRKRPLAENTMKRIARGLKKFVIDSPKPFIVKCNRTSTKTAYDCFRGQGIDQPLQTITQSPGFALVAPFISRQFGQSVGNSILSPLGTVTAGGGGKSQLVTAFLAKHYGGSYKGTGASLTRPMPTITSIDHTALVTSHLVKLRGTNIGFRPDEPMHTVTAGGNHIGEVRAFLLKYGGNPSGQESMPDVVTVYGAEYRIVDIGMRMLQPRELYNAQGFPETYVIDRDATGRPFSKTKQVACCGNAVPPPVVEQLIRANLPELCKDGSCFQNKAA
ncbi:MAG: DNA cytosine methyltransferase [Gammaproteobacteria bacterium]